MITVFFHKHFTKNYRLRILPNPTLNKKFQERLNIFRSNPDNPILKNHPLKGSRIRSYSFSITGDIRVIYRKSDQNAVIFEDIGTHNQVY